jgi:hypothetical protein
LTLTATNGLTTGELNASVDVTGLAAGVYQATLQFVAPGAANNPQKLFEMEQAKQLEAADKMAKAGQAGAGAMQKLGQASMAIPALQQQLAGYLPAPDGEGANGDELQWPEPAQDPMYDLGPGFGSVLDQRTGRMPQGMMPGGGAMPPMQGGMGMPPGMMAMAPGEAGGGVQPPGGARPPMRPQPRALNAR